MNCLDTYANLVSGAIIVHIETVARGKDIGLLITIIGNLPCLALCDLGRILRYGILGSDEANHALNMTGEEVFEEVAPEQNDALVGYECEKE